MCAVQMNFPVPVEKRYKEQFMYALAFLTLHKFFVNVPNIKAYRRRNKDPTHWEF